MLEMTEALRPSELFALRWRSFDNINTLELTETVYRRQLRPFGKTPGSMTKVHLPDGLAEELRQSKAERKKLNSKAVVPDAFIFPNADGGFIDTSNYRSRVLKPLADKLRIPKLNFQIFRRTDGHSGAEDGLCEGYSGPPAAPSARHDGLRVYAGTA